MKRQPRPRSLNRPTGSRGAIPARYAGGTTAARQDAAARRAARKRGRR